MKFIVTMAWDGRAKVETAIRSIAADIAGRPDWELCVCLDGVEETDDLLHLKEELCFKVVGGKSKLGLAAALNTIIGSSDADVIVRMDADDIWISGRAEITEKAFSKECDVLVGGAIPTSHGKRFAPKIPSCRLKLFDNNLIHPAVAFRRFFAGELVEYDSDFRLAQDFELFMRLAKLGARFVYTGVPLIFYSVEANSPAKRLLQLAYVRMAYARGFAKGYFGVGYYVLADSVLLFKTVAFRWRLALRSR